MKNISSTHNINTDIREQGYSVVGAAEFFLSPDLKNALESLKAGWSNLPLDEYLKGGRFRYRRYGHFFCLPSTREVIPLPGSTYFQSKELNKFAGGIERVFSPLLPQTLANSFLLELIRFNLTQFPIEGEMMQKAWEVGVFQNRIVAQAEEVGKPTPEGIHRDGNNFVSMHLIARENVIGGASTIYDNNQQPLKEISLIETLDSIYADDACVMHSVSPLRQEHDAQPGTRDMLIILYDYHPQLSHP